MKLLYEHLIQDLENKNYTSPIYLHYLNDNIQGNSYRHPEHRYITVASDDIVSDFIASMTDDYFIDICRELHLNDALLDELTYYEYF